MARRAERPPLTKGHCKTKKARAAPPAGHDYSQPKLEEGTDAFWQVREKIEMA